MPRESKEITTKTGFTIRESWCRTCMQSLPASEFYECVDTGVIDANGLMSVCKKCIQNLYDKFYSETNSFEKTIHKLCTSLNIRYSNDAMDATKTHINTLLGNGKAVNSPFSIYKMKLTSTKKSMTKDEMEDMTYEDVSVIFTGKETNTKEIPIPDDVWDFWGKDFSKSDVEYLEKNYTNFKQTHKADTYAEIVLLKQVCYTMLDIENKRRAGDDTTKVVKELQDLMKNLAISPGVANANAANKGMEAFGLWIQDIEKSEPAQWLSTDPRGEMYRDVGNVEDYFNTFFVRPLKNFILGSKDFNVDDNELEDDFLFDDGEEDVFKMIDDGTS